MKKGGPAVSQRGYGKAMRAVTAATLVSSYLLVVLGSTVRVTGSGMGCASWPLCNGHLGLSGNYHAMLEQSHRYLATVVTILVVVTFAAAWELTRRDRLVFRSAAASLGLIGVQVILGAVTVWLHNAGWTVALHLACAWLLVGTITVTTLGTWRVPRPTGSPDPAARVAPAGRAGLAAAALMYVLGVSGMLVLDSGASKACPGWPACGLGTGSAGEVALQYLHRSVVLAATVMITIAAVRTLRSASAGRAVRVLAAAALTLLAATAALGGLVATTGAPAAGQDFHLALASALWITVVALATPGAPGPVRRPEQARPERPRQDQAARLPRPVGG